MFLHLFFVNSPIFNSEFINMIQSSFDPDEHHFVFAYEESFQLVKGNTACELDKSILSVSGTIRQIQKYDHTFLHSFPRKMLLVGEKYLKKCSWISWGHDLYYKPKIMKYIFNKVFQYRIPQIHSFIAGFKGDIDYFSIKFTGHIPCYNAIYPMGYDLSQFTAGSGEKDSLINIMIGHSAFSFLQHEKYFNILEPYKEKICLKLILNYGDKDYIKRVKKKAEDIFPHLVVYEKFVDQVEYLQILDHVDCAVFDFEKQAAFGNILLLLYLNKKIYLSETGVMYKTFIKDDLVVYPCSQLTEDLKNAEIKADNNENFKPNKQWAEYYLLKENITKQWENVFSNINKTLSQE